MENWKLKVYLTILSLWSAVLAFAQGDDDDEAIGGVGDMARRGMDTGLEEEMEEFHPFVSIGFSDIFMVLMLILACYVFGKIWKGCSYLLIIVAALFYYLT